MTNGKILIKLDMINDAPGVVLHSKTINGARYYLLSENDIEKIISNHMKIISELRAENKELRNIKSPEKNNESNNRIETTTKFRTGGYGD